MTKRAQNALTQAGYIIGQNAAIEALAEFASQNPGLEFGNYGEMKSYRSEARSINQAWQRFKAALLVANRDGVRDEHVIAQAPHAFSGRLEWKGDHWEYCTGQYFPTEYRKAAATLVEYATRNVRRSRGMLVYGESTMKTYKITGQNGQNETATSLAEAKRIAHRMCLRNVGRSSNMMTGGTIIPAPRLYWQTWCDGAIVGDRSRNYDGTNPMVTIRAQE